MHDWYHYWNEGEKECLDCGKVVDIEKEYMHSDEGAEIGDERFSIEQEDDFYRVKRQMYMCSGWGEDKAEFRWRMRGYMDIKKEEFEEEVNRVMSD